MDVEINAGGRYVKISNLHDHDPSTIADLVLELWNATDPPREVLSTGFTITERSTEQPQPAYMDYGERPKVT